MFQLGYRFATRYDNENYINATMDIFSQLFSTLIETFLDQNWSRKIIWRKFRQNSSLNQWYDTRDKNSFTFSSFGLKVRLKIIIIYIYKGHLREKKQKM